MTDLPAAIFVAYNYGKTHIMCVRVYFLRWSKSHQKTEIEWQTKHWTIVTELLPLTLAFIKQR